MWLLALDSVSERLGSRSGIFDGYTGDFAEPTEERDANEAAEAMALD